MARRAAVMRESIEWSRCNVYVKAVRVRSTLVLEDRSLGRLYDQLLQVSRRVSSLPSEGVLEPVDMGDLGVCLGQLIGYSGC